MKNTLLFTFLVLLIGTSAFAQPGGPGGFVPPMITEIMYNPPEGGNDTLEFLEIYNPSLASSVPMEGFYFSSGVEFTFPAGFVLGAGEYVLLSGDSVIFEEWYGVEAFEWTGGTALSNGGEGITLRAPSGIVVDSVFYDDTNAWADADGSGYSLVLCDISADNNLPSSWTLSENPTGITVNSLAIYADPGAASTCTPTGIADDNVITTLVYPNPSNGEFRIQLDALKSAGTISIYNTVGQLVYSEAVTAGTSTIEINSGLRTGQYILSVETADLLERHKLSVN